MKIISIQFAVDAIKHDTTHGRRYVDFEKRRRTEEALSELVRLIKPDKNYQIRLSDWECDDSETKALDEYNKQFSVVKYYRQILIKEV